MIASVQIADVGFRSALGVLRKRPRPESVPGLRQANVALAAPLGASGPPRPQVGRVALIAFWDDDAAFDRFLESDPTAEALASGWQVRLEPLRAFGTWPGLPDDVSRKRVVEHDGPAAVLTLGRLNLRRAIPFFRASRPAERAVLGAPGL